jgi:hypothetical protein
MFLLRESVAAPLGTFAQRPGKTALPSETKCPGAIFHVSLLESSLGRNPSLQNARARLQTGKTT